MGVSHKLARINDFMATAGNSRCVKNLNSHCGHQQCETKLGAGNVWCVRAGFYWQTLQITHLYINQVSMQAGKQRAIKTSISYIKNV